MNRWFCVYPLLICMFILMIIMWNLFFRLNVLQRILAFTWPKMAEFQWLELHQRMLTILHMLCMRLPSNQVHSADSSKIYSYQTCYSFEKLIVYTCWNVRWNIYLHFKMLVHRMVFKQNSHPPLTEADFAFGLWMTSASQIYYWF